MPPFYLTRVKAPISGRERLRLGEVNFVVHGAGVVNHESALNLLAGILADCGVEGNIPGLT